MKHEGDSDTNRSRSPLNSPQESEKKKVGELEINERIETIQITALLKLAMILRRVL